MHDSHKDQRESSDQDQQRIERLYGTLPGKAHRLHQQLQVSRAGGIFRHAHCHRLTLKLIFTRD